VPSKVLANPEEHSKEMYAPNYIGTHFPKLPFFPFSNFASFSMATAEKFSNQIVKHVVFLCRNNPFKSKF